MTRIVIGKSVGLLIGLLGLVYFYFLWPEASWYLRIGVLIWYPTMGALIGVFGVLNYHPMLKLPLPWWVLSIWIGGWMNFVLALFAREEFTTMLVRAFGAGTSFHSPFWFILDGMIAGLIIGYFATKYGGEGKETVDELPDTGSKG